MPRRKFEFTVHVIRPGSDLFGSNIPQVSPENIFNLVDLIAKALDQSRSFLHVKGELYACECETARFADALKSTELFYLVIQRRSSIILTLNNSLTPKPKQKETSKRKPRLKAVRSKAA